MKHASWAEALGLFERVVELAPHERDDFLRDAETSEDVRACLLQLLAADGTTSGPLDRPLIEVPDAAAVLERWGDLRPAPRLEPGRRVAGYEIGAVLGSGGMGTVYEAWQQEPRRRVALKTLRRGLISASGARRLRREAQLLGGLRHPAIAQVHGSGTWGEGEEALPYIVMEYVEDARDLLAYARAELPEPAGWLGLFLQVCDAIQYGHGRGVIHRDLKPGNLLVDGEGRVKVIDFGLARAVEPDASLSTLVETRGQSLLGTLPYIPPEELLAGHRDADVRGDVYALGVCLYELATGRHPYPAEDGGYLALVSAMTERDPPRISRLAPGLPVDLDWIVAKAIAREPERRYATAAALAEDLRRFLAHEPVLAGPPSARYRLAKYARRHRLGLAFAALLGVTLCAGLAGTLWQGWRARRNLRERDVQLAISTETQRFYEGVFAAVRPDEAKGAEPTVRAALDRAAAELERDPPSHPEVEASARLSLGSTYASLARHAEARRHLERGLSLGRELWGAADARVVEGNSRLVEMYVELRRLEAGVALARASAAAAAEALGPAHVATVHADLALATALDASSDFPGAEAVLRRALAGAREGDDDELVVSVSAFLADHLLEQGRAEEAEELYRWVEAQRPKGLDERDPRAISDRLALAASVAMRGGHDEAVRLYRETLPLCVEVHGEDSPLVLDARTDAAQLLMLLGRTEEALAMLERIRATCLRAAAAEERAHVRAMTLAGSAYLELGRPVEAEELLRAALAAEARGGAPPTQITFRAELCFANVLKATGRFAEAERVYDAALERAPAVVGDRHDVVLLLRNGLGGLYFQRGELEKALALQESVMEAYDEQLGPDAPLTLLARNNLAACLRDMGEVDEARAIFEDVLARRRRVLGADHGDTLVSLVDLALCSVAAGRAAEAIPLLEDALDRRMSTSGPSHPHTRYIMMQLARAYGATGDAEGNAAMLAELAALPPLGIRADAVGALLARGQSALWSGRPGEAAELLEQGLEQAREELDGSSVLFVELNHYLGESRLALGEREAARRAFAAALEQARARLDDTHPLLVRAEQALARLSDESP